METTNKARLEEKYTQEIRPELQKKLGLKNIMAVPRIEKIVVNVGATGATSDSKLLPVIEKGLARITGQAPVRTKARKSIAGFKIREGMLLGTKVTLRRKRMYEFLDRLVNLALPKVRDFQGVNDKFDRRGNYNLGIKDWAIFPELDQEFDEKSFGMNITICTSAKSDDHGRELLRMFNVPFRKRKA